MNIAQSCLYNLPLSVAHVQPEIVGDPKKRVITIVTVSIKDVLYITMRGRVYVTSTLNILEQKMLVFITNVTSAYYNLVCFWMPYY